MSKEIGIKLKQLRKNRKMTQDDVAEKIGITRSTISNYEIGRRTPHLKDLQKLAGIFGVGVDYFVKTPSDEVMDLLARANEVFQSENINYEVKEKLYREFMILYLNISNEVRI